MDDQLPTEEGNSDQAAAGEPATAEQVVAAKKAVAEKPASEEAAEKPAADMATADKTAADQATAANDSAPLEAPARWAEILARVQAIETQNKKSGLDAIPALIDPMAATCPPLAAVLRSSAVRSQLETYSREDEESGRQQKQLKSEIFRSNLCLLAAGILSGVILAIAAGAFDSLILRMDPTTTNDSLVQADRNACIFWLGLTTLALGAVAAYFAYIARDQSRISLWRTSRSKAEMARLNTFSTIASRTGPKLEGDTALYGLAVVVWHLLNEQRTWLGRSAISHRKSSEMTTRMGAAASALAFVGGSGAIIASQPGAHAAIWIVLAGVIGAAISAFAANREALNGDRPNAERYAKTVDALDEVAGRVDGVAAAIDARQPNALDVFVKAVVDVLGAENRQWLEGARQANEALSKLDEQLGQLGKDRGADGATN
jgi:hypothetical protein